MTEQVQQLRSEFFRLAKQLDNEKSVLFRVAVAGRKLKMHLFSADRAGDSITTFGLFIGKQRYSRKSLDILADGTVYEDTVGIIPQFDLTEQEPDFSSLTVEGIADAVIGQVLPKLRELVDKKRAKVGVLVKRCDLIVTDTCKQRRSRDEFEMFNRRVMRFDSFHEAREWLREAFPYARTRPIYADTKSKGTLRVGRLYCFPDGDSTVQVWVHFYDGETRLSIDPANGRKYYSDNEAAVLMAKRQEQKA